MGERSEDRRIQKTRKALHEALLSLMKERKYDSIPMKAILDRANVGRSTFYLHYNGKDELLLDGLKGLGEWLGQEQVAATPAGKHERTIGFSLALFQHAYENKDLFKRLVGSRGWDIVRRRLEELIAGLIRKEARPLFKKKGATELSFDLFVYFLASSFMSVMTWWLNQETPAPPAEINSLFRGIVMPTLAAHL